MLFKKEHQNKLIYIIIAIFCAVLIFAGIMTIVFMFAKNGSKMITSDDVEFENRETVEEKTVLSPAELVENYKKELLNLKSRVENNDRGVEENLADVEQIFLSMTVPGEYRDIHLQSFLKLKELQKNSGSFSKENIIIEISGLIESIVQ